MLCKKCGKNPCYEHKGRVFALCADCIEISFAELFESLDTQRSPTTRAAEDSEQKCPYCKGEKIIVWCSTPYVCPECHGAGISKRSGLS